jgi:GAF domain-containing protein
MAQKDRPLAGFLEQVRGQFALIDKPRRPGYIGRVPYLLILRWFILLGIGLRFLLHKSEYAGWVVPVVAASLVAFALAVILSKRRFELGQSSTAWKVLLLVVADTAVISVVYLATKRVQSDTFLFFFLPLLTAAEYLTTAWLAGVVVAFAAIFFGIVYQTHFVDYIADMTEREAFLRVYLGREFFLFGLTCAAWYLFQYERQQQKRLVHALGALDRASDEAQALFTFSAQMDQLFLSEDLVREAVTLATYTHKVDWGLGILFQDDGPPWQFQYTPTGKGASPEVADVQEMIGAAEEGPSRVRRECLAFEFLDIGDRRLGLLAVGVLPGGTLPPTAQPFLKALSGPLLNGLQRNLLVSSLRRINRATLWAFDFDCELNDTLREVTEDLHMEFGTITLKDDYRGVVETVRGRNVPPGLLRRSRYRMGASDIQTYVITNGKTVMLDGNSELFNQEIFEFFEHHKVARVWVPIRSGHDVIGTIEAGCAKERKGTVLTAENLRGLEKLAERKGPMLSNLRPQALLSLIAQEAIGLIAADSASVHVFQASEPLGYERLQSITQEELAAHFHCEDPVLAAGAGKAGKEFIQAHAPRPHGIGWKSILAASRGDTDGCQNVDNDQLKTANSGIYSAGVRAILAIPLRAGSNLAGVLYVHHWNRHQFSAEEIQIERVFAAQIEVAIQSYFLLRNTAVAVNDSRSLLNWLNVMQSPAALGDPVAVMEELAQTLLLIADASNVVLYQYVSERSEFLRPILKGKFLYPQAMRTDVDRNHLVYQLLGEELPHFYDDVARERSGVVEVSDAPRRRFVDREQIRSCAMLELRARPGDELFGLLFVNYRAPQRFAQEQKNTMQVLASSAAAVIRTARFYEWLKKRQQHIDALRAIDATIVASAKEMNPDAILSSILSEAMLTSGGWAGAVFMRNAVNELETRVAFPAGHQSTHRMGLGAVGTCAATKRPHLVSRITEPDEASVRRGSKSCLAVPLLDGENARGALYVEGERESAFADEDARTLETLAVQAVIALHTIDSYRGLDLERSRAESLSLVAKEIQNSTHSLDLVLYTILTGITAGESLGFSRAMIFERGEGGNVLRGRSAVGETDPSRAHVAWEGIGSRSVEEALQNAIAHFKSGDADSKPLMRAVRGMEIPLTDSGGAVAECVLSRSNTSRCLKEGEPDSFRDALAAVTEMEYSVSFACIPLVGRKENIGALVVDNRFQPGEMAPLSPEMIGRVAAYAELAAMSIEAARLLEKTQTQTYEDLAHQLRNPIFKAANYCEKLMAYPRESEEAGSHLRSLKASIDSAVHISQGLQDYADLAKGRPLHCELVRLDPAALLQSTRESVRDFEILDKRHQFRLLDDGFSALAEITVTGDLRLIREALENLLDNAVKYSYAGKVIEIRATATEQPEGFELYVESEGLPIRAEDIDRLAERGWRGPSSRAVAATGSGIGLWVVDGIMRTLGGSLLATPTTPDNRTRVRLWLPCSRA